MTLNTSRKQVPASAKVLHKLAPNWRYANHILNFGCGRFPDLTKEYLTNYHNQIMSVTNYDPNSKDEDVIKDINAIDASQKRFCVVLCANVLNVCKDLDSALDDLAKLDFDCAVIQIYEGNQTGNGRKTRDGYQRNERVAAYMPPVLNRFGKFDVTLHRSFKVITIIKGRKFYEQEAEALEG
ncbi:MULTISPECIES: hypothetical protein [unclassified Vibrio]|uniref:hypothetical protein n=1 Tax=unclassified Vibrio TaxID=2614977 RepID=UPI00126801F0|nr:MULTISPECIES: hypothetical protein [unclassified Vibrio]QFT40100.1 hypothetical protein FIU99_27290 [Vibrio sp. THAF64]QGM37923.1 hypothetical protein GGC04_26885 [Vibrio sp. THAF191d]QGN73496.1 hypothetical protein GGC03_27285 [Vibrio sp. THAF191c]